MGKQSRLESEALDYRKDVVGKLDRYTAETEKQYGEGHSDTMSHDDAEHPWGKGTWNGGHTYVLPDPTKPKTQMSYTIDTTAGGGSYDKYGQRALQGVKGAFQGLSGQEFLFSVNNYTPERCYGIDSVDTSVNVDQYGQYVVKNNLKNLEYK